MFVYSDSFRKMVMSALLYTLIFALVFAGCVQETPQSSSKTLTSKETPVPHPVPTPPNVLSVTTDKESYLPGENVEIRINFLNRLREPVKIYYPDEVKIKMHSTVIRNFPIAKEEIILNPGEEQTHMIIWDQRDDRGNQVTPGRYDVEISRVHFESSEWNMTIYPNGAVLWRFLIQPLQGVKEGTIELNESRTANGITVALQQIEMTSSEARIYAVAYISGLKPTEDTSAPGTSVPDTSIPAPPSTPPDEIWPCRAVYRIDSGAERDAGTAGIRVMEEGYGLLWVIDPIPGDAEELTFTVIKIGKWDGLWEFRVKL